MIRRGIAALLACATVVAAACAPLVIPAGPPVAVPMLADDTVRVRDGSLLPLRSWLLAEPSPRAVVIGLHGFNDYSNFLSGPGTYFARHGIAAYAYDQRGFGAAGYRGVWAGTATMVDDLDDVVAALRVRHPGVPVFVLGESMGGAVILVAVTGADPPPVDGIILAAPAVWGRATMTLPQTAALWLTAHTVPWLAVSGRGLGIKPSDNVEMLRALGRDPLVMKETRVDAVYGLVDLMDEAAAAAPRLRVPTLILHGERDEIVRAEPIRRFLNHLPQDPQASRRVALYANGYHMLLRDLQAPVVWADIVAWIVDQDAALPSAADAHAADGTACRVWSVCDKVQPRSGRGERS